MIVPIPLHPQRERERGFNQALVIARMLKQSGIRSVRIEQLLEKKRRTLAQSQLRRAERLDNLRGAFSVRKKDLVRGKHILLVDDVITTGSTVNECARTLKAEGAARVDALALARSIGT